VVYFLHFQSRGARAVFQFYPEDPRQVEIVTAQAIKAGFSGGVVVDYPNSSKAKKFFLVLMTAGGQTMPKALGTGESDHQVSVLWRVFFFFGTNAQAN
jgi:18S rRNA (guanine1575-N7)-methyltransferase